MTILNNFNQPKDKISFDKDKISFDKDTYNKRILENIIEEEAQKKEKYLKEEKELIKSWNFKISRNNLKKDTKLELWETDEKLDLLEVFYSLVDEQESKEESLLYKRLTWIIEEMAKNVQKDKYYKDDNEPEKHKKYEKWKIKITWKWNNITISTFNYTKDNINRIPERLKTLNEMSTDELKEEYKKKLNNEKISIRWGWWLWFLDIIRKSNGWKFKYRIIRTKDSEIKGLYISISIPKLKTKKTEEIAA